MPYKALPIIREKFSDYDGIEKEIIKLFKTEFYLPLIKELSVNKDVLTNENDSKRYLIKAISDGQVQVKPSKKSSFAILSGQFEAQVSKEIKELGGKFIRSTSVFEIPFAKLPVEILLASELSKSRVQQIVGKINVFLSKVIPTALAEKLKIEHLFEKVIQSTDKQFKESVRSITVAPSLTKEEKQLIAANYTKTLKYPISDFLEKRVIELRKQVKEHVLAGGRRDELAEIIKKDFGIAQRKAKFIAKQETSLLMSKFKQARYQSIGIDSYKWVSVGGTPAHPVRALHKDLNDRSLKGEVFSFNNPPPSGPKGEKQNPGEPFNCRCTARPIVKF